MVSESLPNIENLKMTDDYQSYNLGDFKLQSGGEIPGASIAYKTLGDPSLPAVIYPTWYSGREYPFLLFLWVLADGLSDI